MYENDLQAYKVVSQITQFAFARIKSFNLLIFSSSSFADIKYEWRRSMANGSISTYSANFSVNVMLNC